MGPGADVRVTSPGYGTTLAALAGTPAAQPGSPMATKPLLPPLSPLADGQLGRPGSVVRCSTALRGHTALLAKEVPLLAPASRGGQQ